MKLEPIELQAISYCMLHLLSNEEFSVRDFASHYVKTVLLEHKLLIENPQLMMLVEQTLLKNLTKITDEMVLKTILDTLRHYIAFVKAAGVNTPISALSIMVNLKDENDDFFSAFLAIKMKSRFRAMKMICSKLELINNPKAI